MNWAGRVVGLLAGALLFWPSSAPRAEPHARPPAELLKLVGADGLALPDAAVALFVDGHERARARTDAAGELRLANDLELDGPFELVARATGYPPQRRQLASRAELGPAPWRLRTGREVRVEVRAGGTPLEGVRVRVWPADAELIAPERNAETEATSDSDSDSGPDSEPAPDSAPEPEPEPAPDSEPAPEPGAPGLAADPRRLFPSPWLATDARTDAEGRLTIRLDTDSAPFFFALDAPGHAPVRERRELGADDEAVVFELESLGAISGIVRGPDGAPRLGARVLLAGSTLADGTRTSTSGPDGEFEFGGVPPGVYDLSADAEVAGDPALSAPLTGLVVEGAGRLRVGLTLLAGRRHEGVIVGVGGAAIAGARIELREAGSMLLARHVSSDEAGRFSVVLPVQGFALVRIEAPGHVPLESLIAPGDAGAAGVTRYELSAAATVRGRVLDEAGSPIAGAEVRWSMSGAPVHTRPAPRLPPEFDLSDLSSLGGAGILGVTSGPVPPIPLTPGERGGTTGGEATTTVATVETDAAGRFELSGIPPGSGRVLARVENDAYVPAASPLRTLDSAGVLEETLLLVRGGVLVVRVVDTGGYPIAGVPVEMKAARELESRLGVTESDGRVRFPGIRGAVEAAARVVGVLLGEGTPISGHAELAVDEEEELTLTIPDAFGRLGGLVLDPEERPIAGARLTLDSGEGAGRYTARTTTDVVGRFLLPGLPEGPWSLRVEAPGHLARDLELVESDEQLRILLARGTTLAGRVVDAWVNGPAAGASLTVTGHPELAGIARDDGSYRLGPVPSGTFEVRAELRGRVPASVTVQVERDGERVSVPDITLDASGALLGEVVDAYGSAVPGASLTLTRESGETRELGTTDPQGRFELRGLRPGFVELGARHAEAGSGTSGRLRVDLARTREGLRLVLDGRMPTPEPIAPSPATAPSTEGPVRDAHPDRGVDAAVIRRGGRIVVSVVGPVARRAGLRAGDEIVAIEGEPMFSAGQVRSLFRGATRLSVEIRRGARSRTLRLRGQ